MISLHFERRHFRPDKTIQQIGVSWIHDSPQEQRKIPLRSHDTVNETQQQVIYNVALVIF